MTTTSHKPKYAVVYGRMVEFFTRPAPTGSKRYREPVKAGSQWYKNKAQAVRAAKRWETA